LQIKRAFPRNLWVLREASAEQFDRLQLQIEQAKEFDKPK
jgi:hypothetical protein